MVVLCVVAPLDQRYDDPTLEVRITLSPVQKVVGPPAVIVAVGNGLTTTVVAADVAVQPRVFVQITE